MTPIPVHILKAHITYIGTNQHTRNPKLAYNRRRRELRTFKEFLSCLLVTLQTITKPNGELTQVGRITWEPTAPADRRDWSRPTWQGLHKGPRPSPEFAWPITRECAIEIAYVHALEEPDSDDDTVYELFALLHETLDILNYPHGPAEVDSGFNFNQGLRTPNLRIGQFTTARSAQPAIELLYWMLRHREAIAQAAPAFLPAGNAERLIEELLGASKP